MRVAIIGSGAIGLCAARELVKERNEKIVITIFDNPNQTKMSATAAAGAMEAVFGEIEHGFSQDKYQSNLVEHGFDVREAWSNMFKLLGDDLCTADSTIVFLNKHANDFETANFNEMVRVAEEYNELEYLRKEAVFACDTIKSKELVVRLRNERAFDARVFLDRLRSYLKAQAVNFVNKEVVSVSLSDCSVKLKEASASIDCSFDKIIVAAGPASTQLLNEANNLIPLFRGMGTALLVENVPFYEAIERRTVYRSVNRGGSQCGLHFVPGMGHNIGYLGAGNSLSLQADANIRFETVRYLMDELEQDLIGKRGMYRSKGSILTGDRCRSMDYQPTFGKIKENDSVIMASGFNRIGLTYAPLIASDLKNIINDKEPKYFCNYEPQRHLIPYGTVSKSASDFADITCANLIEHQMISDNEISKKKEQLKLVGRDLNHSINVKFNLPIDHGHPADALSIIEKLK